MLCSLAPKNSDISHVRHEDELELNALKHFPGGNHFPKCAEGCWLQPSDALFLLLQMCLRVKYHLDILSFLWSCGHCSFAATVVGRSRFEALFEAPLSCEGLVTFPEVVEPRFWLIQPQRK